MRDNEGAGPAILKGYISSTEFVSFPQAKQTILKQKASLIAQLMRWHGLCCSHIQAITASNLKKLLGSIKYLKFLGRHGATFDQVAYLAERKLEIILTARPSVASLLKTGKLTLSQLFLLNTPVLEALMLNRARGAQFLLEQGFKVVDLAQLGAEKLAVLKYPQLIAELQQIGVPLLATLKVMSLEKLRCVLHNVKGLVELVERDFQLYQLLPISPEKLQYILGNDALLVRRLRYHDIDLTKFLGLDLETLRCFSAYSKQCQLILVALGNEAFEQLKEVSPDNLVLLLSNANRYIVLANQGVGLSDWLALTTEKKKLVLDFAISCAILLQAGVLFSAFVDYPFEALYRFIWADKSLRVLARHNVPFSTIASLKVETHQCFQDEPAGLGKLLRHGLSVKLLNTLPPSELRQALREPDYLQHPVLVEALEEIIGPKKLKVVERAQARLKMGFQFDQKKTISAVTWVESPLLALRAVEMKK